MPMSIRRDPAIRIQTTPVPGPVKAKESSGGVVGFGEVPDLEGGEVVDVALAVWTMPAGIVVEVAVGTSAVAVVLVVVDAGDGVVVVVEDAGTVVEVVLRDVEVVVVEPSSETTIEQHGGSAAGGASALRELLGSVPRLGSYSKSA
jgi:hypothetical protein